MFWLIHERECSQKSGFFTCVVNPLSVLYLPSKRGQACGVNNQHWESPSHPVQVWESRQECHKTIILSFTSWFCTCHFLCMEPCVPFQLLLLLSSLTPPWCLHSLRVTVWAWSPLGSPHWTSLEFGAVLSMCLLSNLIIYVLCKHISIHSTGSPLEVGTILYSFTLPSLTAHTGLGQRRCSVSVYQKIIERKNPSYRASLCCWSLIFWALSP